MATLVTITTFLEGFGRARLHRSIDLLVKHSDTLLTELTKAGAAYERSDAHRAATQRDLGRPFKLPRSARYLRIGVWIAVPVACMLFALLVSGLTTTGSDVTWNPADWDPLFTAALVLLLAQVALAVLTYTDMRENEEELSRARDLLVARLIDEAEKVLHAEEAPPTVETSRMWVDAVSGTSNSLPPADPARGVLRSIEARFHLRISLLIAEDIANEEQRGEVSPGNASVMLLEEREKARTLLAELDPDAWTVDAFFADAVIYTRGAQQERIDKLWKAVGAYGNDRPARWLLTMGSLPWDHVIEQHSGDDVDVLTRWRLDDVGELLLYTAGAESGRQRVDRCLLAVAAFQAADRPFEIRSAVRALFAACETPDEIQRAYYKLRFRTGLTAQTILVPLLRSVAGRGDDVRGRAERIVYGWATDLEAHPVDWVAILEEMRSCRIGDPSTVLQKVLPGGSAGSVLAWLSLLAKTDHRRAADEAMRLALEWGDENSDRSAVSSHTIDAVAELLESSDEEVHNLWAGSLRRDGAKWLAAAEQ
jgi:hypothetical protein